MRMNEFTKIIIYIVLLERFLKKYYFYNCKIKKSYDQNY